MLVVAAAIGKLILLSSPHFRTLVSSGQGRLAPLDGLRGFLAFGVFVHHLVVSRVYVCEDTWATPESALYTFFGPGFVGLFFMISGFLFWSRAIDRKVFAKRLFVSRFWRIMPLYWATSLIVILTSLRISHFRIRSEPIIFAQEVIGWVSGGALGAWPFNQVNTTPINAGVTWSLQYEWWFYFTLPVLAVCARPRRFIALVLVFVALRYAAPNWLPRWEYEIANCTGFICGMTTAYLARIERFRSLMCAPIVGGVAVLILAGAIWVHETRHQYDIVSVKFAFPLFLTVACGNTIFGLMTRKWALFLGHISYSLYLAHGFVLYFMVQVLWSRDAIRQLTVGQYWAYGIVVTACVVVASAISYRFIESPFLNLASLRAHKRG